MNSDPWANLYDQAEEDSQNDSLLHKLRNVDVRYLALGSAGTGAMKQVTRTEDRTTGRHIARATLIDHQDDRSVEMFLREARITAHLQHPNIVPVYDIGLDEKERPYFTMKLITGHSLGKILKELRNGDQYYIEEYSLNRLVDIFLKVCDALAYAHSEGVIHLDLKPDNIQVSNFGDVVVCDWGLAALLEKGEESDFQPSDFLFFDNRYKTLSGEIKGTPGYMAPEQTEGTKAAKDQRTDIFSLGCIFYQMLTNRMAIRGNNLERIIENTRNGNITPPSKRRPDLSIPASLEAICLKALKCKPVDRYQSVQDLIDDIESYRSGFATVAEEVSLLNQLRLFYNRNKIFCLTSFVFSLVIVVMAFLFIRNIREKEQVASKALTELKEQQMLNKKIGKEASKIYAERAEKAYLDFNSEAAEALADLALVLDPENIKAREYKGKLCFVRQDFDSAYENLAMTKNSFFDDLTDFCNKVGRSNEKGKMKIQQLLPMSRQYIKSQRYALIGHLLANSIMHQNGESRINDLKWYLSQFNDGKAINVKIHPRKNDLFAFDLSGNKELKNVDCLKDFPIEVLNITNTSVSEISFVNKEKTFRHLRQIVLKKGQLKGKTLWWAEDNYKLIYK